MVYRICGMLLAIVAALFPAIAHAHDLDMPHGHNEWFGVLVIIALVLAGVFGMRNRFRRK